MTPARRAYAALALALLVVVVAWVARRFEGERARAASDAAWMRSDRAEAILHARAAAMARCPGCSAPDQGYGRLHAIAKDAEARGDDVTAVTAWRAIRSATLATVVVDRSLPRRESADAEIARFERRIDAAAAATGGMASPAASEDRLRVALGSSDVSASGVFALLAVGCALFVYGALRVARAFSVRDVFTAAAGIGVAALGALFF